jgi:hypothetical protein
MAGENKPYLVFLRRLPCSMLGHGDCLGAMHAHHPQGKKGIGTKNHDDRAIPLCTKHHTERHSLSGAFKAFRKESLREWESEQATRCRQLYLGLGTEGDGGF